MSAPTYQDLGRAKRIARYLRGTEDIALKIEPNAETEEELHGYADSDWAADRVKRKSTTGCAIQWCGCTLMTKSSTQGVQATSVGEAETRAVASTSREALMTQAILYEMVSTRVW